MFHDMPHALLARMRYLEEIDARDRHDGTERSRRLRQIPPETGRFIAMVATGTPPGRWIEIGTSAGYSALWLALACRVVGRRLTTYEVVADKVSLARQTFAAAAVSDVITLVHGDPREHLGDLDDISFCFLDAEKEIYRDLYEALVPRMARGGLLVADNAISHATALRPMIDHALTDRRVDAMVVPIGKGELVCRKL